MTHAPLSPHTAATALDALATWAVRRTAGRDLSLTAAGTLATLARSGPLRLSDLAGREGVAQPSMTSLVSRLERDGLVGRRADPADGRAVHVVISDVGRAVLAERRARRAQRFADLLERLDPADRDALDTAAPALLRLVGLEDGTEGKNP